jgi:DNA (cytosine-5)-methyltransferase 1
MDKLGLSEGEIELFAGGPPCQSFSTAGRRLSINDARGNLMLHYISWIDVFRPKFFILENVRGLLSAPIKHTPHADRDKSWVPSEEEAHGSALRLVISEIERIGYKVNYRLVNAADYGVPQTRERVIILGSRDGSVVEFPKPTHSKVANEELLPWVTLRQALDGLSEKRSEHSTYSEARLKYLRMVPSGGNWRSLPEELQQEAMGGAYKSGGGKVGFYRRLSWDKPSPTVTTAPHQKATDMCHPEEHRPLSVREYARIQQFPDDWKFFGSTSQKYKQIGNAVPVGLGRAVGEAIVNALIVEPSLVSAK